MAKKKITDPLVNTKVTLRADLQDIEGEPHSRAGETLLITEKAETEGHYWATNDLGHKIMVAPSQWAESEAAIAMDSPPTIEPAPALAEQLATISLYLDPAQNFAQLVDLDLIDDSPSQPRTHYPEAYITGLTDSMRVVGMISPMLLRPKEGGRFENVFGHCRKRAARAAGFTQGPAFVRELTDAESAQLQAVENLQRKDLDAIDEAHSFAAYIKAHGCTKDEFCRRTGLSRTHVYNRLKLATLLPAGCEAMRNGLIKPEVATMIARVPGDKQQTYALKIILDNSTKTPDEPDEVMTVRRARAFLREKFTLDLKDAIWELDDATLLADRNGKTLDADYVVACTVCPKRSGVDQIVYVDLLGKEHAWSRTPGGENVCTDPACFDAKKTAQLKRNQAALEAKGKTVIAGNKARQIISAEGNVKAGYIALKDVKAELTRIKKTNPEAVIEVATAQNPRNGKTIEVVKIATLQDAGGKVEAAGTGGSNNDAERLANQKKKLADMALNNATHLEAFMQVRNALKSSPRSTFDMQLIAIRLWNAMEWDQCELVARVVYQCEQNEMEKRIGEMDAGELALFFLDCTLTQDMEQEQHWATNKPEALIEACEHYGVDLKAIRKACQAAAKAKPASDAPQDEEEEAGA